MIMKGYIAKYEMQLAHLAPLGPLHEIGVSKQTCYLLNEAEGNR